MASIICISIGGVIGTLARYFVSVSMKAFGSGFPYGTMLVNIFGCFILGFVASVSEGKLGLTPNLRLLLIVGFCGAFTTFSTFILETANLMKEGEMLRAFVNVTLSVLIGFIILKLGVMAGESI